EPEPELDRADDRTGTEFEARVRENAGPLAPVEAESVSPIRDRRVVLDDPIERKPRVCGMVLVVAEVVPLAPVFEVVGMSRILAVLPVVGLSGRGIPAGEG